MKCERIERELSQISAKIANAIDLLHQTREFVAGLEFILIGALKEVDALYIDLEDNDLPKGV